MISLSRINDRRNVSHYCRKKYYYSTLRRFLISTISSLIILPVTIKLHTVDSFINWLTDIKVENVSHPTIDKRIYVNAYIRIALLFRARTASETGRKEVSCILWRLKGQRKGRLTIHLRYWRFLVCELIDSIDESDILDLVLCKK